MARTFFAACVVAQHALAFQRGAIGRPCASGGTSRARAQLPQLRVAGKETTWDRLTGPKLFKSVKKTEGIHAVRTSF